MINIYIDEKCWKIHSSWITVIISCNFIEKSQMYNPGFYSLHCLTFPLLLSKYKIQEHVSLAVNEKRVVDDWLLCCYVVTYLTNMTGVHSWCRRIPSIAYRNASILNQFSLSSRLLSGTALKCKTKSVYLITHEWCILALCFSPRYANSPF